ncbi:hypothetical protein H632_c59p1 [Helicosporidium sp. ATCC 50920]|nr:hypothetical protein H632_c59p1 [Helicosporidium sp. ATCC 50920]|eukprot:KDD76943.1 hypothetical protein H632_c59p1 [Helicosporidium sp. ATCC 50920]
MSVPRGVSTAAAAAGDCETESGAHDLEQLLARLPTRCLGCGVKLQSKDSDAPGYYQIPRKLLDSPSDQVLENVEASSPFSASPSTPKPARRGLRFAEAEGELEASLALSIAKWNAQHPSVSDLDISACFPGDAGREEDSGAEDGEANLNGERGDAATLRCARCHSLKFNGVVPSAAAESRNPSFDVGRVLGPRLHLARFRRRVVVAVLDASDLAGSLCAAPLAQLLGEAREGEGERKNLQGSRRERAQMINFVVAVTKFDVLPGGTPPNQLAAFVRGELRRRRLPKPHAVHVVSARPGHASALRQLLDDVARRGGDRGDVWVVGAQNAGKSSLLNALRRGAGLHPSADVTAAALPGTTLGLVPVPGLMKQQGCHVWDSPGVVRGPVLAPPPAGRFRPRSFRIAPGQSLLLGGGGRVDVVDAQTATIYLTLWAPDRMACHFGRSDRAALVAHKHRRGLLRRVHEREEEWREGEDGAAAGPGSNRGVAADNLSDDSNFANDPSSANFANDPSSANFANDPSSAHLTKDPSSAHLAKDPSSAHLTKDPSSAHLAKDPSSTYFDAYETRDIYVRGESWTRGGEDLAIGGLGWLAACLKGEAHLRVWVPRGTPVSLRPCLLPQLSKTMERPGFAASSIKMTHAKEG